jgi:hypothetical protein
MEGVAKCVVRDKEQIRSTPPKISKHFISI